jgi:hypothetical protein
MSVSPRTIPSNLGGRDDLFEDAPLLGQVEGTDGIVAFGPASIIFLVLNSMNFPASIALGVPGFMAFIGSLILILKPDYISLTQIVKNYMSYRSMPDEINKKFDTMDYDYSDPAPVQAGEEETVKYIGINRLYPRNNALEREDGEMVGMVEIGGMNLDTKESDRLRDAARSFEGFFNNQLADQGFQLQLYMPMRRFDPGEQVENLDARKEDDDVIENPIMQRYVEDRKNWLDKKLSKHLVRKFYVSTSVSRGDISDTTDQGSLRSNISELPLGAAIEGFLIILGIDDQGLGSMSEEEVKKAQFEELNKRLEFIRNNLKQSDKQYSDVLGADEIGVLLREYWEGEFVREAEIENFIRRKPIVTKKR